MYDLLTLKTHVEDVLNQGIHRVESYTDLSRKTYRNHRWRLQKLVEFKLSKYSFSAEERALNEQWLEPIYITDADLTSRSEFVLSSILPIAPANALLVPPSSRSPSSWLSEAFFEHDVTHQGTILSNWTRRLSPRERKDEIRRRYFLLKQAGEILKSKPPGSVEQFNKYFDDLYHEQGGSYQGNQIKVFAGDPAHPRWFYRDIETLMSFYKLQ